MTQLLEEKQAVEAKPALEKVLIVVSKGSLEGVYPALILANAARMEGIEADLFFTFFGLDAIHKDRCDKIKVATVGNPGLHMPTLLGGLPGVSAFATWSMKRRMEKLDIPPVREFVKLISDSGAGIYACQAAVDLFGYTKDDFVPEVRDIITVGDFYALGAGGEIIFT